MRTQHLSVLSVKFVVYRIVAFSSLVATALGFIMVTVIAADPPQATDTEHHYFHNKEEQKPHAAEWGYSGKIGPSHWGELAPEYAVAKNGKRQSPIDLRNTLTKALPRIDFNYRPSRIHLIYNGHTIQENEDPGSFGMANDKIFELQQFHFHAPSEHTVDGKHFAMEMHLVHKAKPTGQVESSRCSSKKVNTTGRSIPFGITCPTQTGQNRMRKSELMRCRCCPRDTSYYSPMMDRSQHRHAPSR